jgi:hypothetical protein
MMAPQAHEKPVRVGWAIAHMNVIPSFRLSSTHEGTVFFGSNIVFLQNLPKPLRGETNDALKYAKSSKDLNRTSVFSLPPQPVRLFPNHDNFVRRQHCVGAKNHEWHYDQK